MRQIATTLGTIAAFSLLATACATTETNTPTHRWAGNHAADSVQYHQDHAYCSTEAGLAEDAKSMNTQSPIFVAYKQCMTSRGYQLTAYRD